MSTFFKIQDGDKNISVFRSVFQREYKIRNGKVDSGALNTFLENSRIRKQPGYGDEDYYRDSHFLNSLLEVQKICERYLDNKTYNQENPKGAVDAYLEKIHNHPKDLSQDDQRYINIIDFKEYSESEYLLKNSYVKNILPKYRRKYSNIFYGFTNYNLLNFAKSDDLANDVVLIYPNLSPDNYNTPDQLGKYSFEDEFTIEFYINPRYPKLATENWKGGCIAHLPGHYSIFLLPGEDEDENGYISKYEVSIQFGENADLSPENLTSSEKNSTGLILEYNNWYHIAFRRESYKTAEGNLHITVNGMDEDIKNLAFDEIPIRVRDDEEDEAYCLFIGNQYQGTNLDNVDEQNGISRFFNHKAAYLNGTRDLQALINSDTNVTSEEISEGVDPEEYSFEYIANCDLANIKFYNKFIEYDKLSVEKDNLSSDANLVFHLPLFFVENGPEKKIFEEEGLYPFDGSSLITDQSREPFNYHLAYTGGIQYVNVENFLQDLANDLHPRILGIHFDIDSDINLEDQKSVKRRNLLILPNDNGLFRPNFSTLENYKTSTRYYKKYFDDEYDYSAVNLTEIYTPEDEERVVNEKFFDDTNAEFQDNLQAISEKDFRYRYFYKTWDKSSNIVKFFSIPKLFFGEEIFEKSIEIKDGDGLFEANIFGFKIKDDGNGVLYRADAFTDHAKWNNLGHVIYPYGNIAILHPSLRNFGKQNLDLSFKGINNIPTMELLLIAESGMLNKSDDTTKPSPSDLNDSNYAVIGGILILDDEMNVVGKANLAQPILKNQGDRIGFKIRYDF